MSKTGTDFIQSAVGIFKQYKLMAEKAMEQINDEQFFTTFNQDANSVALVVKHMAGNMQSRWSEFLHSDGEKSWRNRDMEFEIIESDSRENLMIEWNKGWQFLFDAISHLNNNDLGKITTIRSESHSVLEAVNRQIAHYSYHIGQIVFIAKTLQSNHWKTLSIAKGESNAFNKKMNHQ